MSVYSPLAPAVLAPGLGPTYPKISITTSFATANAVKLEFEYLPESVSFGVSAVFDAKPIFYTSGRWLTYSNSDIEEVSLNVKVVAGCNNCITRFGGNIRVSGFLNTGGLVVGKFERNSLIIIAKLLYSLPLPANNNLDASSTPPPTCRLIVGKMFYGVGAFTGCSIAFNGPYDYDGSPTDMDVSLRFMPSEFYDSTAFTGLGEGAKLQPTATPTGESEITGNYPYALTFRDTATGVAGLANVVAIGPSSTAPAPYTGIPMKPAQVQGSQVQGPTNPTPTDPEVAVTFKVSPKEVKNHALDPQPSDTYTIAGILYKGAYVRERVYQAKTQLGLIGIGG